MLRYIDLTGQIYYEDEDEPKQFSFAWFDTVVGKFLRYQGTQVWDSWKDFLTDVKGYESDETMKRFGRLFPDDKKRESKYSFVLIDESKNKARLEFTPGFEIFLEVCGMKIVFEG